MQKVTRNKLRVRAAGCQYIDKVLADTINVLAELWLKKKLNKVPVKLLWLDIQLLTEKGGVPLKLKQQQFVK